MHCATRQATELGESYSAAVDRHRKRERGQMAVGKSLMYKGIHTLGCSTQPEGRTHSPLSMVNRPGISLINKNTQHTLAHKLHMVGTKQMHGVAHIAVQGIDHFT